MIYPTSASQTYRPTPTTYEIRNHLVIHSAVEDIVLPRPASILFFDTPLIDAEWSVDQYTTWFRGVLAHLNSLLHRDAVLIFIPRDRKGTPWLKSIASAAVIQETWPVYRHIIWHRFDGDFQRAKYAFSNVYLFRRGYRSSNQTPLRYQDVVRIRDVSGSERVGAFSIEVVVRLLELFMKPGDLVFDPFAGTGAVALACDKLNLPSVSVDISPVAVDDIVRRLTQ